MSGGNSSPELWDPVKEASWQLSAAEGAAQVTTGAQSACEFVSKTSVGQFDIEGGCVSFTVIAKTQVDAFPNASMAM